MAARVEDAAGKAAKPEALLLVAPGCPHCGAVLDGLATLVKEAVIGRLTVVNVAAEPEEARRLGARSVPWARVGEVVLTGLRSPAELRSWAESAGTEGALARYFDEVLREGRLPEVRDRVRQDPKGPGALVALLADPATGLHPRLGVAALLEELAAEGQLEGVIERLGRACEEGEPRIQVDALHILGLSRSARAVGYVRARLADDSGEVREAAAEALEGLRSAGVAGGQGP